LREIDIILRSVFGEPLLVVGQVGAFCGGRHCVGGGPAQSRQVTARREGDVALGSLLVVVSS
jgi:hypothetical protein